LPMGIYGSVCGIIPDLFNQLIVFPLTVYPKTSAVPMPRFGLGQPLAVNTLVALYYLPPAVLGLTAVFLLTHIVRRRFSMKDAYGNPSVTGVKIWGEGKGKLPELLDF
jgi:hypothetical protein